MGQLLLTTGLDCGRSESWKQMKRTELNLSGQPEDFYALGRRALLEELGLNPHDYGDLHVTWVGIYQLLLRGHALAVARLRIPKDIVVSRARESDSSYEHSNFDWLPLNRATHAVFAGANTKNGLSVGASLHVHERDWLEQSRLSVLEAWRFRVVLDD